MQTKEREASSKNKKRIPPEKSPTRLDWWLKEMLLQATTAHAEQSQKLTYHANSKANSEGNLT